MSDAEWVEPPMVAASEAEIVEMARALTAPQAHDVWTLLASSRSMPPKVGPTCAELVGDALAQIWPALWRREGAKPGASIRAGKVIRGRGWERNPPSPLEFSPFTLAFLRWLVEVPLAAGASPKLAAHPVALGDQVVAYLALSASIETPAQLAIARYSNVALTPLAWLGFAHVLPGEPPAASDWDELVRGPGAVVIEALQQDLAKRWRTIELTKRTVTDPETLIALGRAQDLTLTAFMDACSRAGRRDLAGFVIDAMVPLLGRQVAPFPNDLDRTKPLSARTAARKASGALLRGLETWLLWDRQHRGVRFLDDDYEASQLLLTRFEKALRNGADILLPTWLAELASLAPTSSATIDAPEST
ncbi:hypothetical protein BH11MYX1_BH11MYX1_32030 [soil metagenome]